MQTIINMRKLQDLTTVDQNASGLASISTERSVFHSLSTAGEAESCGSIVRVKFLMFDISVNRAQHSARSSASALVLSSVFWYWYLFCSKCFLVCLVAARSRKEIIKIHVKISIVHLSIIMCAARVYSRYTLFKILTFFCSFFKMNYLVAAVLALLSTLMLYILLVRNASSKANLKSKTRHQIWTWTRH